MARTVTKVIVRTFYVYDYSVMYDNSHTHRYELGNREKSLKLDK